ncbi:MAG: hypothetical protein JXB36_13090 [Gammaproteobacteria bacterium]|nr:hypothetical protein [Gammaproteobacteria bacterium]
MSHDPEPHSPSPGGLEALVRAATAQYQDPEYAISMGYEPGPCVSGPNGGAMGVHFVKPALLDDAQPKVDEPEALIYQPMRNGRFRLVGVEYIAFEGPAALEGHLLHYAGSPNRYGLPPFYQLHVWAWKPNPNGTFADWNPDVSCDAFVAPPM